MLGVVAVAAGDRPAAQIVACLSPELPRNIRLPGMAPRSNFPALFIILIGLAGPLPGCVAAAAAAAGAGTGVYLTSRGAESVVQGSIDAVEKRARAVFAAEGIP